MPRPKGKETDVIYTTWDLPATARPHDTRIAADGTIFFNHFNDNAIGRLDPKTGEVKEWHWPYRAKEGSFQPTGARTLMGPDQARPLVHRQSGAERRRRVRSEDRAIRVSRSAGRRRDDRRLGRARRRQSVARGRRPRRGRRRVSDRSCRRGSHIEIKGTNEKPLYAYDIAADTRNNVYGSARNAPYVWRIDAKTHAVQYFDIPPEPRGAGSFGPGMRRGITDSQDRLWWGGYDGGYIGLLDPRKPARRADEAVRGAVPVFLPVRRALRRAGLHVDGRHLRGSRRAHERRERRMEFLSVAVRSEHPRHQPAAGRRATACRDFGSATRIKR